MDEKFQTSQQKAGEHQLAEGKLASAVPTQMHGTEDAPTGIATSAAVADPFKTTSNLKGELSLSEGC